MTPILPKNSLRFDPMIEAIVGIEWKELGPGVMGYELVAEDAIQFIVVEAVNDGNGDVSRWLDSLPTDRTYRIPAVMTPKLAEMLARRGWTTFQDWFQFRKEMVTVYERKATS